MSNNSIITLSLILGIVLILLLVLVIVQILFELGKLKRKPLTENTDVKDVFSAIEASIAKIKSKSLNDQERQEIIIEKIHKVEEMNADSNLPVQTELSKKITAEKKATKKLKLSLKIKKKSKPLKTEE